MDVLNEIECRFSQTGSRPRFWIRCIHLVPGTLLEIFLCAFSVELPDAFTELGIRDYDKVPALQIRSAGCLKRDSYTLLNDSSLDGSGQIESSSYGPRCGQKLFRSEVLHHSVSERS